MSVLGRVGHLVIDTGPVCLRTGYFLEKAGRDYLMAEKKPPFKALSARVSGRGKPTSANTVHRPSKALEYRPRNDWNALLRSRRPTKAATGSTGRPPRWTRGPRQSTRFSDGFPLSGAGAVRRGRDIAVATARAPAPPPSDARPAGTYRRRRSGDAPPPDSRVREVRPRPRTVRRPPPGGTYAASAPPVRLSRPRGATRAPHRVRGA